MLIVYFKVLKIKPTTVDIKKETVMGGMSCGDVSVLLGKF